MTDLIKDWRTYATLAILIGYLTVAEVARRTDRTPVGDEEMRGIINHHVDRCELMANERTGYACDT